jgi:hypothetical protein
VAVEIEAVEENCKITVYCFEENKDEKNTPFPRFPNFDAVFRIGSGHFGNPFRNFYDQFEPHERG